MAAFLMTVSVIASRTSRSQAGESAMEEGSTDSTPIQIIFNRSWITKLNNASIPPETIALSMSEYDANTSISSAKGDVIHISQPRYCTLCKKQLNCTKNAIVHDLSRGLFWHTNCYNYLLWKQQVRQMRLKDNVSDTTLELNQEKNQTTINVPYGANIQTSTHNPLFMHLCVFTMILVPIAIILWLGLCSIELNYCDND